MWRVRANSHRAASERPYRRSHEVDSFQLLQQPIVFTYDDFDAFLLALAHHLYGRRAEPPFPEFLGETMDRVYRVSGVLGDTAAATAAAGEIE